MKIDLAKRRKVMERSVRLGHCICEPRRPCPCPVFQDHGICPCAGERPDPIDLAAVRLTTLVRHAGCASKIAPADLETILRRLPPVNDPAVLSGLAAADDAAIYRLDPGLCLVQTVDVFTPCVDDPALFGRICAANCLSDIYAMGGTPRTALSILAFPSETLPGEIMYHLLAGAMETLETAGVALLGGHSIKDDEIKLGFAVTGVIDPAVAQALDRPQVGDWLVLTKPLGTGVLAFGQQIGRSHPAGLAAAARSMTLLNRAAAEAMCEAGASAATDITGFGLFGHLIRLLRQHGLTAALAAANLPAFPGVLESLHTDVIPGAVERNREFVGDDLEVAAGVDSARVDLGFDAQTSGGLLIAVAPARLDSLTTALDRRGVEPHVIGRLVATSTGRIQLVSALNNPPSAADPGPQEPPTSTPPSDHEAPRETARVDSAAAPIAPSPAPDAAHEPGCCADVFGQGTPLDAAAEAQRAFGALMRSVQAGGVLDARTKELVLFSLVVLSRCTPCFASHYEKALQLGLTEAQLDEAAWCAIAMGGAPVKMFYQEAIQACARGR